jgi:carbamoyltransferase
MGLSAYGSPDFVKELKSLIQLKPRGEFELDLSYFSHWTGESGLMHWANGEPTSNSIHTAKLETLLGPARRSDDPLTPRHEAIAASLQQVFEGAVFHVLKEVHRRTQVTQLCLAGGCALNSVVNGKIRKNTPFERVYIQPAAGDNGTALGAAFHVWHQQLNRPRSFQMDHGYWGPTFSESECATAIDTARSEFESVRCKTYRHPNADALSAWTAERIAEGKIVGWFQGGMEWGSRALGHRSILADPRRAEMREIINATIKFREAFRPFAPSILEERLNDFFDGAGADPFMTQVYPLLPHKKCQVPAIIHVDGTGRIHTVNRDTNPLYWQLIREFESRTGVPIVLNTSFNENEPIVHKPAEALDCFFRTGLDVLVLGSHSIEKLPPRA